MQMKDIVFSVKRAGWTEGLGENTELGHVSIEQVAIRIANLRPVVGKNQHAHIMSLCVGDGGVASTSNPQV
jgi:hypothetical protein